MPQEESIAALRSRVTELVEQEGALLTQAFELSRGGGDRRGVDALFARVQAIQVERNFLKTRIGNVLGTHRLHEAREVWKPGVYDYCREVGGDVVRLRVTSGPLGLQAKLPQYRDPVNIETLQGTFDGPLAVDDAAVHEEAFSDGTPATPRRGRSARKS
ncbi:hypothetical protein WG902_03385 [Ramlibacter sp. PS3R-8]|uniref:hypothetical protein n=1 Tax=Ramlibacter sp. PS3R-8 TaxID=3133437 RepID=UPI0030A47E25